MDLEDGELRSTSASPTGDLGVVGVVAVGMSHVASVVLTTVPGTDVANREEFGFFHFGGSAIVILFQEGAAPGVDRSATFRHMRTPAIRCAPPKSPRRTTRATRLRWAKTPMAPLPVRDDPVPMSTDLPRRASGGPSRWGRLLAPRPFIATTDPLTGADLVVQTFCDAFEHGVATTTQAAREITALRPRTHKSGGGLESLRRREHLVLDWFIRTYVPAWLRAADLRDAGDRLVALNEITDVASARATADAVQNAEMTSRSVLLLACTDVTAGRVTFARDTARGSHYASAGIAATVAGGGVLGWPLTGQAASEAHWAAAERAALDACTTVIVRAVGSTANVSETAQAAVHDTTAVLQRSAWRLVGRLCEPTAVSAHPAAETPQQGASS